MKSSAIHNCNKDLSLFSFMFFSREVTFLNEITGKEASWVLKKNIRLFYVNQIYVTSVTIWLLRSQKERPQTSVIHQRPHAVNISVTLVTFKWQEVFIVWILLLVKYSASSESRLLLKKRTFLMVCGDVVANWKIV